MCDPSPHLGFSLLLLPENCFWCLQVLLSYQRQMTSRCLPFSLLFEALWQSLTSKAGRGHLPMKLGVNCRAPPSLPLSLPQPTHLEYQGPRRCIWILSSYLRHSQNPSTGFPSEKNSVKQNIFKAIIKCRLISIEIFSPFMFFPLWMGIFLSELLHMFIFYQVTLEKEKGRVCHT